jgi:hypothetical protein
VAATLGWFIASTLLLGTVAGATAAGAQETNLDDQCPSPSAVVIDDPASLTNELTPPELIPNPVALRTGGEVKRWTIDLGTDLEDDLDKLRAGDNFQVTTVLKDAEGDVFEGALVASAAVVDDQRILVPMCLDPSPPGRPLEAGVYQARVQFVDDRIPESAISYEVWVSDASSGEYLIAAVTVGIGLLISIPVLIAFSAISARRNWLLDLRSASTWLVPLLCVGVVGYLWAASLFPTTDQYHLWALSPQGLADYAGFAIAKVGVAMTAAIAVLAFLPRWRDHIAAAQTVSAPIPTTPSNLADDPQSVRPRATSARSPGRPWAARFATAALLVVLIAAVGVVALTTFGDEGDPNTASPVVATRPQATTPTTWSEETSVFATNTTTIASTPPSDPPTSVPVSQPDPGDTLAQLEVGDSSGTAAVQELREAGFVVFAYDVCSDSVTTPGALRQVRRTSDGAPVVGHANEVEAAPDVAPPEPLDVLIATGAPC